MKKIKLTIALSILGIGGAIAQEASKNIFNDDCFTSVKMQKVRYSENFQINHFEYNDTLSKTYNIVDVLENGIYKIIIRNGDIYSSGTLITLDDKVNSITRNMESYPYENDPAFAVAIDHEMTCKSIVKNGTWHFDNSGYGNNETPKSIEYVNGVLQE